MNLLSVLAMLQDPEALKVGPELLTMVLTYGGLAAVVAVAVEILKKWITKGFLDGKEHFFAFLIAPVIGAAVKGVGYAYADYSWLQHMGGCLVVGAAGAGFIHDKMLSVVLQLLVPSDKKKKGK